ncbi:MAG: hypothetical protein KIH63_000980 [Candidatus Saccharibacteria bacterium]|nr:hypothetical protein [Candidatus Saccharibacteria bacterium]
MKQTTSSTRYIAAYAKLLGLYPAKFRDSFKEPMLQTFGDLCQEQLNKDGSLRMFVLKTCLETGLQIIKERSREVAMHMRSSKTKFSIGVIGTGALAVAAFALLNQPVSSTILPLSTLKKARAQAKHTTISCLANDRDAEAAVKHADGFADDAHEFSKFELEASGGILDVPAGTGYEVTVHDYDGKTVHGSIAYNGDYGTYNYTINRVNEDGDWRFVSMVGCKQG